VHHTVSLEDAVLILTVVLLLVLTGTMATPRAKAIRLARIAHKLAIYLAADDTMLSPACAIRVS